MLAEKVGGGTLKGWEKQGQVKIGGAVGLIMCVKRGGLEEFIVFQYNPIELY